MNPSTNFLVAIARAAGRAALTLALASVAVFALLRVIPGDPAAIALGTTATPELLAKKRAELGTDQPLVTQYFHWIGDLATGNFGKSLSSGAPLTPLVLDRLQVSLILVGLAMALALVVAVPLGTLAAMHSRGPLGAAVSVLSQVGIAVPSFLAGILLVSVFAVHLGWLPANGWTPPAYGLGAFLARLVLPVVALALVQAAMLTRYVRTAVLDVLHEDYVRTARAKGRSPWGALRVHGLRNAALPVLTVTGVQLASLVIGAVVIEQVFSIPGLGTFLLDAVAKRDLPAVQAVVMVLVVLTVIITTAVDVLVAAVDPRVREAARA